MNIAIDHPSICDYLVLESPALKLAPETGLPEETETFLFNAVSAMSWLVTIFGNVKLCTSSSEIPYSRNQDIVNHNDNEKDSIILNIA